MAVGQAAACGGEGVAGLAVVAGPEPEEGGRCGWGGAGAGGVWGGRGWRWRFETRLLLRAERTCWRSGSGTGWESEVGGFERGVFVGVNRNSHLCCVRAVRQSLIKNTRVEKGTEEILLSATKHLLRAHSIIGVSHVERQS